MKKLLITSLAAILAISATTAMAQQKMDGMNTMSTDKMMEDMPMEKPTTDQTIHMAKGKATKIDAAASIVTLAHEPVKSLNWPAMTMSFKVKDKVLLDKLTIGKTVDVEFVQAGKDYIITGVK